MAPTIHLVRHAQGFHNLSVEQQQLRDPDLTDLGKEQCAALSASFPLHDRVTHLAASPIRRTIYTCLLSFDPVIRTGQATKVIAAPDAQEISARPCDTGSDPAKLRAEFEPELVDLELAKDGWNDKSKGSRYRPKVEKLQARARDLRVWLRQLVKGNEDAHVVLVTHGGILHFITEDWDGYVAGGTGWQNCEYRSYQFAHANGDESASLKETEQSWQRRKGSAVPLNEMEQMQFRQIFFDLVDEESRAFDW